MRKNNGSQKIFAEIFAIPLDKSTFSCYNNILHYNRLEYAYFHAPDENFVLHQIRIVQNYR